MGRDKLAYGKKKQSIRIWVETEKIEKLGVDKIKKLSDEAIDKEFSKTE